MMPADHDAQPPAYERPFSMQIDRRRDVAVVQLCGSCTMGEAAALRDRMSALAAEDIRLIAIDMHALDFIESTGLGGVVAAYLRLRRRHGDLRIVAPPPDIRHLLEVTRLNQLFKTFDTIEAAMS